jgi:hypothetical protein
MVVANCVAALSEINEKNCDVVLDISFDDVFKLLNALNACTEYVFFMFSSTNLLTSDLGGGKYLY